MPASSAQAEAFLDFALRDPMFTDSRLRSGCLYQTVYTATLPGTYRAHVHTIYNNYEALYHLQGLSDQNPLVYPHPFHRAQRAPLLPHDSPHSPQFGQGHFVTLRANTRVAPRVHNALTRFHTGSDRYELFAQFPWRQRALRLLPSLHPLGRWVRREHLTDRYGNATSEYRDLDLFHKFRMSGMPLCHLANPPEYHYVPYIQPPPSPVLAAAAPDTVHRSRTVRYPLLQRNALTWASNYPHWRCAHAHDYAEYADCANPAALFNASEPRWRPSRGGWGAGLLGDDVLPWPSLRSSITALSPASSEEPTLRYWFLGDSQSRTLYDDVVRYLTANPAFKAVKRPWNTDKLTNVELDCQIVPLRTVSALRKVSLELCFAAFTGGDLYYPGFWLHKVLNEAEYGRLHRVFYNAGNHVSVHWNQAEVYADLLYGQMQLMAKNEQSGGCGAAERFIFWATPAFGPRIDKHASRHGDGRNNLMHGLYNEVMRALAHGGRPMSRSVETLLGRRVREINGTLPQPFTRYPFYGASCLPMHQARADALAALAEQRQTAASDELDAQDLALRDVVGVGFANIAGESTSVFGDCSSDSAHLEPSILEPLAASALTTITTDALHLLQLDTRSS
jgi:hypothetical protein